MTLFVDAPELFADALLRPTAVDVEQDDIPALQGLVDPLRKSVCLQRRQIYQTGTEAGLMRQMREQVGLVHRRDRMPAHHRMPVDAEIFAAKGGEQIAECV